MSGMVEPISGVIGALIVEVSFVMFNYQFHSFLCFFYLLFWLPHDKLWTVIKGTASLT